MTGRPTKWSPQVQEQITEMIRLGNYPSVAAEAAGVDSSTYFRWMDKGAQGRAPYRDFRDAVIRAERESERALVGYWRVAAAKDWRAARDLLGRRFGDRWAKQEKVELSGSLSVTQAVRQLAANAGLTPEEIAEAEEIAKGFGVASDDTE